jgi:hypothetical protein
MKMSSQITLEQLEQQTGQLPAHEQLQLIAYISGRLSRVPLDLIPAAKEEQEMLCQQRERAADELLARCDAAAEMWEGEFDAAQEIRQMRQERDEQVWLSRS